MGRALLAGGLLLLPAAAQAGPRARTATLQPPASAPRVQRLSFDDDEVSATRDLGDGDLLVAHPKPKLVSLVRPRDSFVPELIKSAEDL